MSSHRDHREHREVVRRLCALRWTVIIFILMVNLVDTRRRIFSLWKLVVVCGAALGVGAIKS